MRGLAIRNLIEPIKEHIHNEKPFLGICLGMQMMMSKSFEFGEIEGLGIINGDVIKIPASNSENIKHKIPHIGWNRIIYKEDRLLTRQNSKSSMYFVHSYKAECKNEENVLAYTLYNDVKITAIIKSKKHTDVNSIQKKAEKYGLKLLDEFIQL